MKQTGVKYFIFLTGKYPVYKLQASVLVAPSLQREPGNGFKL